MTTESDDGKIDVNKLLDKPYSELTDAEIEAVINFKAEVRAHEQQHEEFMKAYQRNMNAQLEHMRQVNERNAARQDELLQASVERLKRSSGVSD